MKQLPVGSRIEGNWSLEGAFQDSVQWQSQSGLDVHDEEAGTIAFDLGKLILETLTGGGFHLDRHESSSPDLSPLKDLLEIKV